MEEKYVLVNGKRRKIYGQKLTLNNREIKSIAEIELLMNCAEVTTLTINKCKLESMEGLNFFPKLETLDLNSNCIQKISDLNHTPNLKYLYLNGNKIHKIENLDVCPNLLTVNLARNKIAKIENLGSLRFLEQLDLGMNELSKIENLEALRNLKTLILIDNKKLKTISNLDGNILLETLVVSYCGLTEISGLNHLIHLKSLRLSLSSRDFNIQGLENLIDLCEINLQVLGLNHFYLSDQKFIKLLRFACILKKESYAVMDWENLYFEFPRLFKEFVQENSYSKKNWYLAQCGNITKILPKYREDLQKLDLNDQERELRNYTIQQLKKYLELKPPIKSLSEIHSEEKSILSEWRD